MERILVTRIAPLVVLIGLGAGCRPIAFTDAGPFTVVGQAPVEAPKRAEVQPDRIQLREKIQFEVDSSEIKSASHGLLNQVAELIQENQQIRKIRIEGHASADGKDSYNLRLSGARAEAVRQYLIGRGVGSGTLVAQGFGETRPVTTNATEQGRETNRRVELHIVELGS